VQPGQVSLGKIPFPQALKTRILGILQKKERAEFEKFVGAGLVPALVASKPPAETRSPGYRSLMGQPSRFSQDKSPGRQNGLLGKFQDSI
jgi:hypothetical protein